MTTRPLNAFPWYGGKTRQLKWLLPQLPEARHFIEPFGGSAAVLLNRVPSVVETYNDIDGRVVNFFRVLREHPDELRRVLTLTPHSRLEFSMADIETDDPIENARRFYFRTIKAYGGSAAGKFVSIRRRDLDKSLAETFSTWLGHIDRLPEIAARLILVNVESLDAIRLIEKYDDTGALFYLDPPYAESDRESLAQYRYEVTSDFHTRLSNVCRKAEGRIAISGYHGDYDDLYPGWRRTEQTVTSHASGNAAKRVECLWMNYDESGARIG